MKIFSYFYRVISMVLILSLGSSLSALSIASLQQDSLTEILNEAGFKEEEKHHASTREVQKKVEAENIPVSTEEISRIPEKTEISSDEVQRILGSVIHEKNEKKLIQHAKKCVIPAKIPEEIAPQFAKATENIPCELLSSLRKVEIFKDPRHIFPRAMANGRILKIRSDAVQEPEFIKVLIHELGHVVDLGGLKSQKFSEASAYKDGKKIIYADDLSVLFYQISWQNESVKKPEISDLDFVGGYSSSDMFEDYAESFLMYLKHGNEFRILAEKNPILQKKYNFFKKYVFNGKEFHTGERFSETYLHIEDETRPWDITKF